MSSHLDRRLALAYRLYRPFEQRMLARSSRVIATSPSYIEASEALAPWRSRCVAIPLGIDPARLIEPTDARLAHAHRRWGEHGLRILAIGRLTYYKGHDVLIHAMNRLSNARLLIVGTGERHRYLMSLIRSLGLAHRVELLGFRPEAELNGLLATCDLLCLPSVERTEAFGLVLLEAMRYAKPVVVSDIPGSGTGWVVREAGHGLLVAPNDSTALASALRALRDDPERRRHLGQQGHAALSSKFGIGCVANAMVDLYQEVLSARTT